MKKLVSHIVEIEVPDDFPSGHNPEAVFEYVEKHSEIGDKIIREYRKAYDKWLKNKTKANVPKTSQYYEFCTYDENPVASWFRYAFVGFDALPLVATQPGASTQASVATIGGTEPRCYTWVRC